MQLIITDAASKWFQDKFELTNGNGIKLYGKTVQPHNVKHSSRQGYAVEDNLGNATVVTEKDGINYHINFEDGWFFSGMITTVDYHVGDEQPIFTFSWEHNGNSDVDASTGASSKYEEYWE